MTHALTQSLIICFNVYFFQKESQNYLYYLDFQTTEDYKIKIDNKKNATKNKASSIITWDHLFQGQQLCISVTPKETIS